MPRSTRRAGRGPAARPTPARLAELTGATVLLKGATTLVVPPGRAAPRALPGRRAAVAGDRRRRRRARRAARRPARRRAARRRRRRPRRPRPRRRRRPGQPAAARCGRSRWPTAYPTAVAPRPRWAARRLTGVLRDSSGPMTTPDDPPPTPRPDARGRARRPASASTSTRSAPTSPRCRAHGPVGRGHGRGQGRRLRPRAAARARGPRSPAARPGSASPSSPRRSRCARRRRRAPLLTWLHVPGRATSPAPSPPTSTCRLGALGARRDRGRRAPAPAGTARVHLKVDTGLGRNGALGDDWPDLVAAAPPAAQAEGAVERRRRLVALRLRRRARAPDACGRSRSASSRPSPTAERAGLRPEVRHLANSAATLTNPSAHFDLVRPGIAVYGLSPVPDLGDPATSGCAPAMTLRGPARPGQAACRPGRASPTATPTSPTATPRSGLVPLGLRRRHPAQRGQRRPGARRRARRTDRRPGLHGPVRRRPRARRRRRGPATRSCCSAGAAAASRRRRTGPTRPAPSPTRSSRGSGRGCRGSTSEDSGGSSTPQDPDPGSASARRRRVRPRPLVWPRAGDRCGPQRRHGALGAPTPRRRPRRGAGRHRRRRGRRCTSRSTTCPQRRRPRGRRRPDRGLRRHGYTLSLRCWVLQRRALRGRLPRRRLGPARPRPVGPRRRGVGHHRPARPGPPRVMRQAAPEGPLVLVGHSMGGMTMMSLAGRAPRARPRAGGRRPRSSPPAPAAWTRSDVGPRPRSARSCERLGPVAVGQLASRPTLVSRCSGGQRPRGLHRRAVLVRLAGAAELGPAHRRHDLRHPARGHLDFLRRRSTATTSATALGSSGVETSCSTAMQDLLTPPAHSEEIVRLHPRRRARRRQRRRARHHARAPRPGQRAARSSSSTAAAGAEPRQIEVEQQPRVRRIVTDVAEAAPASAGAASSAGPARQARRERAPASALTAGRGHPGRRAARLGRRCCARGDLVVLTGDLGAGKTTLTQGIGRGPGGARADHLADLRHRPGAPVAGRRPGAGPRRRLPARRRRSSSTTSTSTPRSTTA